MDTKIYFNNDGSLDIAIPKELLEAIKYGIYMNNAKRLYIDASINNDGTIDFKMVFSDYVDIDLYNTLYHVGDKVTGAEYAKFVDDILDEYVQDNILPDLLDIISEAALTLTKQRSVSSGKC
jgi:hypothetical protein